MDRVRMATVRNVARRLRLPVLTLLVALLLFGAGFYAGRRSAAPSEAGQPPAVQQDFTLFWQVWDLVEQKFVNTSALNTQQMVDGAIRGMLTSLNDPGHTRFLTSEEAQQEQHTLSGQFVGIGIEIAFQNNRPVIVSPIHDSPAERAGLQAGDVIVMVNGVDTAGMTPTDFSSKVRGPAGTSVTLGVLPAGSQQIKTVTVTRAAITVPSVLAHPFTLQGRHLADIQITQFAANADQELRTTLAPLQKGGLDGAVIDLRNDPGGYRDQAIAIASEFLTHGNVLLEQDRSGKRQAFPVKPGGVAPNLPIVLLINQGTASSAEIMAGAIKDQQRGLLVGETTFGTGTVLQEFPLRGGAALLLGVDEWLTPNGQVIWHHGITPNIDVTLPTGVQPITPDQEANLTSDQLLHTPDTQFTRALQVLLQPGS
jgi:carboxyl-terminal processing protease